MTWCWGGVRTWVETACYCGEVPNLGEMRRRALFSGALSGEAQSAVERHGSCAVEAEHDGDGGELCDVVINAEALMDADGEERHQHVDGDEARGQAGEEAEQDEDAADKFRKGRDVAEPVGKSESDDVVDEVMQRGVGRDLLVSVDDHGESEDEAQQQGSPWLKVVQKSDHKGSSLKVARRSEGVRVI